MFIENLISKEIINKGWSGDKKYRVSSSDGSVYLLRISPLAKHERRKREFDKMCEVAKLGIPMAAPLEFGICDGAFTPLKVISRALTPRNIFPRFPLTHSTPTDLMQEKYWQKFTHYLPRMIFPTGKIDSMQKLTAK